MQSLCCGAFFRIVINGVNHLWHVPCTMAQELAFGTKSKCVHQPDTSESCLITLYLPEPHHGSPGAYSLWLGILLCCKFTCTMNGRLHSVSAHSLTLLAELWGQSLWLSDQGQSKHVLKEAPCPTIQKAKAKSVLGSQDPTKNLSPTLRWQQSNPLLLLLKFLSYNIP